MSDEVSADTTQEAAPDEDSAEATAGASGARPVLTEHEARALGCLIEKEMTTPEYYPLTLKALAAACNQRSNRQPVMDLGDADAARAADGLRRKNLAAQVAVSGSRVPKFRHLLRRMFEDLGDAHFAALAVLILRGVQSAAEVRSRSERLHYFDSVRDVEVALDELARHPAGPLVRKVDPGAGRQVRTFAHLLCGEPEAGSRAAAAADQEAEVPVEASWRETVEGEIRELRETVSALRAELDALRRDLGA